MSEAVSFPSTFFSVARDGDRHLVTVERDQLTDEDNLEQFGQDFNLLIEKHEVMKFALLLSRVKYMTSSAIGKLITLHRKVNRLGGTLVLCELNPDVSETLGTAQLLTYFNVSLDLATALQALTPES